MHQEDNYFKIAKQYGTAVLIKFAENEWFLEGSLTE
jgi:hypothetical protein